MLRASRLLRLLGKLGGLLLHGVRQLLRQLAGPLGELAKGEQLAIKTVRATRYGFVEVTLEAVPQQHKEGGLGTTYRMLAAKLREGGRVRAKQLNQVAEGGRSLRLRKDAAVEASQRVLRLRQEVARLAASTLQRG